MDICVNVCVYVHVFLWLYAQCFDQYRHCEDFLTCPHNLGICPDLSKTTVLGLRLGFSVEVRIGLGI